MGVAHNGRGRGRWLRAWQLRLFFRCFSIVMYVYRTGLPCQSDGQSPPCTAHIPSPPPAPLTRILASPQVCALQHELDQVVAANRELQRDAASTHEALQRSKAAHAAQSDTLAKLQASACACACALLAACWVHS